MRADMGFVAGLLNPDVAPPDTIKGKEPKRFAVYRNNVTIGLMRAMEANFPAVRRLLGEVYFSGLVREFVQVHPPQLPLMFLYGDAFPDYLAAAEDFKAYPYLPDVARLEQIWRKAYHETDARVLAASAFTAFGADEFMDLSFQTHPSFSLFRSNFATLSIFDANRFGDGALPFNFARPEIVLVTRPELDVQTRLVTQSGFLFLDALASGLPLGDAAEQGAASDPEFDLAAALRLMLEAGAFQAIRI